MKKRLLLAAVLGTLAVAGAVVVHQTRPGEGSILPPCLFHEVTGFRCAGCGITRALHALLHLRVGEALAMNPLVVAALPLIVLGVVIESLAWIMGERYRGPRVRLPMWAHWVLLTTILAYWILRNIPAWPFSLLAPH